MFQTAERDQEIGRKRFFFFTVLVLVVFAVFAVLSNFSNFFIDGGAPDIPIRVC